MQTNFIIKNKIPRIKSLGDNITSHHNLGAFLSSQDIKMVQQEGNDTNCFVSLVVDTPGNYVAIVTRKVQTKSEVTIKNLGTSYEFFGEGSKTITKENSEITKVIDKEFIEYFDLEVERHEVINNLAYLDDRFDEIEKKKVSIKNNNLGLPFYSSKENNQPKFQLGDGNYDDFRSYLHRDNNKEITGKELDLFNQGQNELSKEDNNKLNEVASSNWKPDPKKVHRAVCNMVTCNLIINPDKLDLKQWIHKHMVNVYERIFNDTQSNTYENVNAFAEWRDFITQFTMDYFDVSDAPDELLDNWDVLMSTIAIAIYDELSKYANENIYIQSYQDAIEQYIVQ